MSAPFQIGPRVLNAADEAIAHSVRGLAGVAVQLSGTFVGTVTFEGTIDGANWTALNLVPSNSATAASTATTTGIWMGNCAGLDAVRARLSAYTSGSVNAYLQGTLGAGRY